MLRTLSETARISQGLSLSGRGAGAQPGDWELQMVESGDVEDDGWLTLADLKKITIARNARTERHLLRPYDVLLTARTGSSHSALVPPEVSRTVAGVTLLVVRPREAELGMGHWLWYYLTSAEGRSQLAMRSATSTSANFLSAKTIGDIVVPVPTARELDLVARLVEASEKAYATGLQAVRERRETIRDAIVHHVVSGTSELVLEVTCH